MPAFAVCAVSLVFLLFASLTSAAEQPWDPWATYNTAVQAYAARDFTNALEHWEDLSIQRLPRGLRLLVWFQLGNTQFRLGEPLEAAAPEEAAELWRRSCDAYRSGLIERPRDEATRHNLDLVQRRLGRLLHRLGVEAFDAAAGQPTSEAIARLRDSVEHLNEAVALTPEDAKFRQDRDRALEGLHRALLERAANAEKRGDESVTQRNSWADRTAEREYRAALEDLVELIQPPEAPPVEAESPSAAAVSALTAPRVAQEGHARVSRKLADLLTRIGQREQKEGTQLADWAADEALDQFSAALEHFNEAQEVQPGHADAERGAREVRAAMEKLLVEEGQAQLQRGKEQFDQRSPQAARSLQAALSSFEEALEIRPTSVPAQNGADEARRLLPEALTLAGQSELRAGDRAEPNSPTEALSRYQQAETDFQQSLELEPGQPQAQQGIEEVQPKLARLRERIVREAESLAKQMAQDRQPPTLESLLGQVEERQRPPDTDRQRQRGRKDTGSRRTTLDW